MREAIDETQRRRQIQQEFNEAHGITPTTIEKAVSDMNLPGSKTDTSGVVGEGPEDADEAAILVEQMEEKMQEAASNLEFELAADIRDRIRDLRHEFELGGAGSDEGVEPELSDW